MAVHGLHPQPLSDERGKGSLKNAEVPGRRLSKACNCLPTNEYPTQVDQWSWIRRARGTRHSKMRLQAVTWMSETSFHEIPLLMSGSGRVSRASPAQTAVRNCTRDEGGPFEAGSQVLASSHRKLLSSKAMVVSVAETPGQDSGRQG
jgi:hypothetical protein